MCKTQQAGVAICHTSDTYLTWRVQAAASEAGSSKAGGRASKRGRKAAASGDEQESSGEEAAADDGEDSDREVSWRCCVVLGMCGVQCVVWAVNVQDRKSRLAGLVGTNGRCCWLAIVYAQQHRARRLCSVRRFSNICFVDVSCACLHGGII